MSRKKKYRPFDWIPWVFGKDVPEPEEDGDGSGSSEEGSEEETESRRIFGKKRKQRKGIDDEDPVSFRTAEGPLTVQQMIYYAVRDLFYASGPMLSYILISVICIMVGYPFSGMGRFTFREYLDGYSNIMIAFGVLLTLRRLYRKSRKNGSTFFEDASLYHTNISWKKILMGTAFGLGMALFLSAALTLIPKVWIFSTYNRQVSRIYQRYDIILTILESAVFTPLVEEIIFRGYMLNRLLRRWPDLPALIVTTVIFSIMHGSSVWILYAFAMGWIIGRVSMKEGNILYGIFIHAGFNLPSVVQWFYYFMHPERQTLEPVTGTFIVILMLAAGGVLAALAWTLYKRELEQEAQP